MRRLFTLLFALSLLASCASEPGARSLDELDLAESRRTATTRPDLAVDDDARPGVLTEADARPPRFEAEPTPAPAAPPGPPAATTPATAPEAVPGRYEALEAKGVRGGRFTFEVPGTPAEVGAMLLDFERAAGHRAWADRFEVLERADDELRVRWHFQGKAGVDPAPVLQFQVRRREPDFYLRFRIVEEDFGLAAFFGDYHAVALEADAQGPRSRLAQRVFIDSGLWIANASADEIEAGLREDARLLRDWMKRR